ncbi:hypothetical protein FSP39_003422 [Pinctada imbricata]|uniref:Sodium-coupled monocarboxylate transporter 1 n=1 Tax=Pinctada imbricata TaxID=66713 RepID=A0AA89BTZ4_PINIB|nr:hypothetical protein FSP39_003422 [Pinctada imbricata]
MVTRSKSEFDVWDWVVFALMLLISASIGIYYAIVGRKSKTTGDFLMGGRNMALIPVALSILVSFMSAILILGTPAEMYTKGTQYFMYIIGIMLAVVLAAQLFVPLLYPLKLTSSFEYLERRFDSKLAKLTGTIMMILQQVIYMGIASYAPSTALEAVTGFPTWATIITVGVVSTFYTFLGGMKAVVWTDAFQSMIMLAGLLAIVIQGAIAVGGIENVWRINDEWHRIEFFDFNVDPTQRHSFWSLIIGGMVGWTATYGCNQASVQRYCALPTIQKAKTAVLLNIIGVFVLVLITCLAGIVVFAFYAQKGCDPLTNNEVENPNQIIPLFVLETLGYPGLPGLFISCLFSGALSTMSSCLNALSAVTWEDILKPFWGDLSESKKTWITRLLVALYGGAGIGMSFVAMNLGGTVLQASLSFTGAASGPLLGIFLLGALFPWANYIVSMFEYGAVVGSICGLALPFWISIGAYSVVGQSDDLPYPTDNCTTDVNQTLNVMSTMSTTVTTTTTMAAITGIDKLYTISYLWYPSIGTATVVVVGLIVSFMTGPTSMDDVDPKYLIPLFDRIFCCLPASWRKKLRCNMEFQDPKDIRVEEKDVEMDVTADGETLHTISNNPYQDLENKDKNIGLLGYKSLGYTNDGFQDTNPPPYEQIVQNGEISEAKTQL